MTDWHFIFQIFALCFARFSLGFSLEVFLSRRRFESCKKPSCYGKCPDESGLTKKGKLPPDPDACVTCEYAIWNYEYYEEEEMIES